MTKQQFKEFLRDRYVLLDGATGSNLIKKGMPSGVCPEQWILEHPQILTELQRSYVEAGTNILYAPIFTANRIKLAEYGLEQRQEDPIPTLRPLPSRRPAGTGRYARGLPSPGGPRPGAGWADSGRESIFP